MVYHCFTGCLLLLGLIEGGLGVSVVTDSTTGTFNIEHSSNQLDANTTFPVLIVPGSELDHPGQTNISSRYSCGRYTFIFLSEGTHSIRLNILISAGLTPQHNPKCYINWSDGTSTNVLFDKDYKESRTHTFPTYGIYPVRGTCRDNQYKDDDVVCPNQDNSCVTTPTFFESSFKSVLTPLKYLTIDQIVIKSLLRLNTACNSSIVVNIWRLTRVINTTHTEEISIPQSESSVLTLGAETLEPGEYIVFLEVSHLGMGTSYWIDDFMFMYVALPELIPFIDGGHLRYVSHGGVIYINASASFDPISTLPSVTSLPLNATWSLAYYTSEPTKVQLEMFQSQFPISVSLPTIPVSPQMYRIEQDNGKLLEINTTLFEVDTWAFVMFSITRGDRKSSALQIIKFVSDAIPVTISCVYNCNKGRERKFNYDRLELDSVLHSTLKSNSFRYAWSVHSWNPGYMNWYDIANFTSTGKNKQSIYIKRSTWSQGTTYRIVLTVTAKSSRNNYNKTVVELYGTVSILPYGGSCGMSSLTGQAARTWFVFNCTNWMGPDQRRTRSSTADVNPMLTFTAYQHTTGALVEEEPILLTRSVTSNLILKLGDPNDGYRTTIRVRVTDIYKNYKQFSFIVTALPAFAWYDVTPDEAGKAIITSYTNVDYVEDERELVAMGKIDLIVPLVSSVCSHIHLITLPQWAPPVPRRLNDDGFVLDLKSGNNTDTGGLDELMDEAIQYYDLATLALMEVMQNMTTVLRNSSKDFSPNSTRETDKFLGSTLTNAFNNLVARKQYVNDDTKIDIIYFSELVGSRNLDFKDNSTVDESAQIEKVSAEVYNMSQAIVNNVVPDDLTQFIHVSSFKAGRTQINDMLGVVGQGIDINNASMSPAERTHLYIVMQNALQLELVAKKETAREAARMSLNMFKMIQDTLRICATCSNYGNNMTDQLVAKNTVLQMKETDYRTTHSTFRLDGLGDVSRGENGNEAASISAVEFAENVFMYDDDQKSSSVTSNVLHIDVKLSHTRVTPTSMTFNQTVTSPPTTYHAPLINEEDVSGFSLHTYIYRYNTDHTCLVLKPDNETIITVYTIYVRLRYVPTILEYDVIITVQRVNGWKVCVSPELMQGYTGLVYIGVQIPEIVRHVNYSFTLVTLGCLAWEEGINKWHSDKCDITWYENENILGCACRNLTDLTFGNTFFVAANTIDFSTVFLKFSPLNQAAVLGAIGCILLVYAIALAVVIRLDRKDMIKWGITPLRDNAFGDNHYYIIKVYTGLRKSAGTTSKIAFILSGYGGDTGPRELSDGLRTEFSTGSVRSFFMATRGHLGCLFHLYVWHDNSGKADQASWYLSRIEVLDLATKQTTAFVAGKWLSADTDLDLEIKATPSDETVHFDSRFFYQGRDRLSDSHMWVSILYRPQASTFTRAQRASCALVYIFLAMIANAMYFNPEDDYERAAGIQAGPLRFSLAQIYISIICAIITTPVVMVIILLFKRSKSKDVSPERSSTSRSSCCCCCCRGKDGEETYDERLNDILLSNGVPDFKSGLYLPHRCVYVAWVLVVLGVLVPAFFIVLYSMEWGKQKSEEWLSTFLLSIIESMLFVDPIMVIMMSFVLACIIRKPSNESNIDYDRIIENYQKRQCIDKDGIQYIFDVLRSVTTEYEKEKDDWSPPVINPPIRGKKLNEAASEFRHHKRMISVLMDLVLNFLLIVLLSTICYSNRDDRSFRHQEYIVNQIADPNYFPSKTVVPRFQKIISHEDLFDWVNQTAFPSIFPEEDMTGQPLHWTAREYMSGFYNYRLGPPRIRQLRTGQDICSVPRYGTVWCYGKYAIGTEHTQDYCIGWKGRPGSCPSYMSLHNVSLGAWSFTSTLDIWGLPTPGHYTTYGGGGYIATFDINLNISIGILNELFQKNWLDRQTRAVFFEFTTYCASTNMFIYSSFLVEFPETGGAVTSYSIYPMRLYNHIGAIGFVTLLFEIIFVIYTIVLLVKLCVRFYQERWSAFTKFWLLCDTAMFVLATCSIIMFLIRLAFTYLTNEKFKEDKRSFVNFSHIVFWDQMLLTFLAFLLFLATVRILEVIGQAKKVQAVSKVFRRCGRDLVTFGVMFCYIFVGFCLLGNLLFGSQLMSYMSVYRTLGTLFITMLGVSKYTEINDSHPVLAKVFFFIYTVCITFFILTLFLSILSESVDDVIKDTRKDTRQDIIEYVMDKMKSLVVGSGSGKRPRPPPKKRPPPSLPYSRPRNGKSLPYMLSKGAKLGSNSARQSSIMSSD